MHGENWPSTSGSDGHFHRRIRDQQWSFSFWASEGRSQATRARATQHKLHDAVTLAGLCRSCSIIVSICPPHAAVDLARQVIAAGFKGLYLDANAISPRHAIAIAEAMQDAGLLFVDGGIIGGPAWHPGATWLYLSGPQASRAAACFSSGPLETKVIGEVPGSASALKMCYAAYSKGTTALLCAVLAASEAWGIRSALSEQWERDEPGFAAQAEQRVRRVTAKAWRFEGEMREISSTLTDAGLPGGFHKAAAGLYHRLSGFKEAPALPTLETVLTALLKRDGAS
jgi:3-hydroxyisobutyrate dehydrogenase-like beta-hydroxyacid dehydrogenase